MAKKNKKTIEYGGFGLAAIGIGLLANKMLGSNTTTDVQADDSPVTPPKQIFVTTQQALPPAQNTTPFAIVTPNELFNTRAYDNSFIDTPPTAADYAAAKAAAPALFGVTDNPSDFIASYKGLFKRLSDSTGILPEVAFSQALAEAGDSSGKWPGLTVANANNFFGIKAGSDWTGDVYIATDADGTPLQYFRKYDTPEDSIIDYYSWMVKNGYAAAAAGQDANGQIDAIAARGYAAAPGYSAFLKSILPRSQKLMSLVPDNYVPGGDGGTMTGGGGLIFGLVTLGLIGAFYGSRKKKGHNINGVGDWLKNNPKTAGAVAVGVLASYGIAYYMGGKKNNPDDTAASNDNQGTQDLNVNKSNLTDPTGAKYKIIAENIFDTMNNSILGGDSDLIINSLSPLNGDELNAVVKAFGNRSGKALGISLTNPQNIFGWFDKQLWLPGTEDKIKAIFAPYGLWS